MILTINTDQPLLAPDRKILLALLAVDDGHVLARLAGDDAPSTFTEMVEHVIKGDDTPTLDDAVAAGSKLMAEGKGDLVREVLEEMGVERVSKLPDDSIAVFLDLLSTRV